jgi:inorganic pyrophosphatase
MSNDAPRHKGKSEQMQAAPVMLLDVQIEQPRGNCPIYTWERERGALRLTGVYQAQAGLPADLAVLQLEGQLQLPVLVLTTYSSPPGTLVQARLLGALGSPSEAETSEGARPSDGWVFVAAAEVEASLSSLRSLEMLPPAHMAALKAYVHTMLQEEFQQRLGEVAYRDAETAARIIRETRLHLKREQRAQARGKGWLKREEEARPVAWRAIEGLSEALRAQMLKDTALQGDAPHAQAEHLIRFVPQRFQHALADLLLDDERLLAFVERPLLRHRAGWLGLQMWRSNEGLFLITDRQVLWLRDFLSPGHTFLPGGYMAHMAPLERLQAVTLLPPGKAPGEFAGRLESPDSPYQRLVMEVASCTGSELFVVEFPDQAELAKALARMASMLRAFLPSPNGTDDRRVRRLPLVGAWLPRGAEAEQLAALGGVVPQPVVEELKSRLSSLLKTTGEELLAEATVPALEDYKSPARLIALTRQALLVLEDGRSTSRRSPQGPEGEAEGVYRYDLTTISSAQLRQSLLGSSLSIFVPRSDGRSQQHVFPFSSPAIVRFLPLFTRLRLLLSAPYRTR